MFYKFTGILVLLILCISCATSPQNKLPSTLNGNGILVVPQTATSEHSETGIDFAYCYVLSCQPKTDLDLKIIPNASKKIIIINDFPPGNYTIDGYTVEGIASGVSGGGVLAYDSGQFRRTTPFSFQIKPNTITILNRMFETKSKGEPGGGATQYFKTTYLIQTERENVIEELKKLENFGLWEINY